MLDNNKFKKRKKEKRLHRLGFTLVEIMVVMGIIAMLSTLAVSGYLSYRRSALLDLGVDNLISQINAMKAKATYGTTNDAKFQEIKDKLDAKSTSKAPIDSTSKCYGVLFQDFVPSNFSVDFINKKRWETISQSWEYQGCNDEIGKSVNLDLDSQMKILEINGKTIEDVAYNPVGQLAIRFLPPNGKFEVVEWGTSSKPVVLAKLKTLTMKINYGSDNKDTNYQRLIDFDLSSGKFSVKHIDENAKK